MVDVGTEEEALSILKWIEVRQNKVIIRSIDIFRCTLYLIAFKNNCNLVKGRGNEQNC